jgi:hypothetical protein
VKPIVRFMLVFAFVGIGLVACAPTCDGTFVEPQNLTPFNMSMVGDLRPTLTWDYPEGYCDPQEYTINLFTNSTNGTISPVGFGGPTGSPDRNWTPPSDLTTGVAYLWSVASKNGSLIGPPSDQWQFFVGPVCQTMDLVAPDPVEPIGGVEITTTDPTYIWSYPDPSCAPEGYHLQVSEFADFSSLTVNMRDTDRPFMAWTTGVALDDCTDYYWRVAAVHDTDDGPWSVVSEFSVDAYNACACTLPELVQPIPVWPAEYEIVPDLLPVLEWSFPGDCEVEGYGIHLSPDYDFVDTSLNGGTGSPSTSWMPGVALEPATQYWWEVFAGVGTDFGPPSPVRTFFTGPECGYIGELDEPELIFPANGAEITESVAWLHWKAGDPGCIPDGYLVDLQTTSDFSGTNLLTEYSNPATNLFTDPLDDCEIYYWRVAGVQDSMYGPYSEARWFRTNISGTCLYLRYPVWVLENIYCRSCGDKLCPEKFIFEKGMLAEVLGRSVDGAYLKLRYPHGECYAPSFAFDVPLEQIEMVRMPPTPEPPPVCSADIDNKEECEEAGGKWVQNARVLAAAVYYCECGD